MNFRVQKLSNGWRVVSFIVEDESIDSKKGDIKNNEECELKERNQIITINIATLRTLKIIIDR